MALRGLVTCGLRFRYVVMSQKMGGSREGATIPVYLNDGGTALATKMWQSMALPSSKLSFMIKA
jgi:hypothetical protein